MATFQFQVPRYMVLMYSVGTLIDRQGTTIYAVDEKLMSEATKYMEEGGTIYLTEGRSIVSAMKLIDGAYMEVPLGEETQ